MEVARREHACLFVEFEETKGILVTGGKFQIETEIDRQRQRKTETEKDRDRERQR
jgi:hypothetical protein